MDHLELLRSLTPETRADLTRRSDAKGLQHLIIYLASLLATTVGIVVGFPLWPLLVPVQGILLVFLFTLGHECTHQTPFRTPLLNEVVGHAIAPLIALPFIWFRYFHMAHHRHTNDPVDDPELASGGRPRTFAAWLIYLSGLRYWSGMAVNLGRNAFGRIGAPYLPPRKHRSMRREARMILSLYCVAFISLTISNLVLWIWLIPVLIGQPFLRAYLLAEHGLCPPVADMLANSRTTLTTRAVRFLAWNMPFHAEHHALPSVPFHRLPDLHAHTAAHLKTTSDGYVRFTAEYARSLER